MATGSSPSVGSSRINSSQPRAKPKKQRELCPHPLRQLPDFTFRREFKLLQEMAFESVVPSREERSRKVNDLADAHVVVEPLVLRNEGHFLTDQQALSLSINAMTEDCCLCPMWDGSSPATS